MDAFAASLAHAAPAAAPPPRPLTERLLHGLPGSRSVWRTIWALAPVLQSVLMTPLATMAGLNPYGWALLSVSLPLSLILSFSVAHALWAVRRIVDEARSLSDGIARLTDREPGNPFAGIDATRWPATILVVLVTVLAVDTARMAPVGLAGLKAAFDLVIYLPIVTWTWTFLMLMVGLRRLGRERLTLDAYCGDLSLGLHPVGRLAAIAFWAFVVNLLPILVLNVTYPLGLGIGLTFFVAGVIAFFLSLHGLHRQMLAVRRGQMAHASGIYALAYEPLRADPTLETLQRQSPLLSAAEALERRAATIQAWPFTNAILARIVLIASSVFTAVVTRLVVNSIGL